MHSFNLCAYYICIVIHFNHKSLAKSDTAIKSGCVGKAKQTNKNLSMEVHSKTDKKSTI